MLNVDVVFLNVVHFVQIMNHLIMMEFVSIVMVMLIHMNEFFFLIDVLVNYYLKLKVMKMTKKKLSMTTRVEEVMMALLLILTLNDDLFIKINHRLVHK